MQRDAPRARRPRTATCSTPTTTWPRSSTCACASSRARWPPSWCSRSRSASTTRPSGWSPGRRGLGLLLLDGMIAVEVQVGDRTATELVGRRRPAAGRRRRPATTCSSTSRPGTSSCPARVAVLDAGFAERVRPWPQIALALLRRAGKRAERPRRAARHRLPAAARGAPGAGAVAPRRALGQGRAGRHPPVAARSRTGCSGSSSAPSGRRSPTPWRAWPRPGSSPAAATSGTCTASLEHHLASFAERGHPSHPQTAAAVRTPARA